MLLFYLSAVGEQGSYLQNIITFAVTPERKARESGLRVADSSAARYSACDRKRLAFVRFGLSEQ